MMYNSGIANIKIYFTYLIAVCLLFTLDICFSQELKIQTQHSGEIERVVVSDDGEYYASHSGKEAFIWNAKTGKIFEKIIINERILTIVFSYDNKFLNIINVKGGLINFNLENRKTDAEIHLIKMKNREDFGSELLRNQEYSIDGKKLLIATNEELYIFERSPSIKLVGERVREIGNYGKPNSFGTWCTEKKDYLFYSEWEKDNTISIYIKNLANERMELCRIDVSGKLIAYEKDILKYSVHKQVNLSGANTLNSNLKDIYIAESEKSKRKYSVTGKYGSAKREWASRTILISTEFNKEDENKNIPKPAKIIASQIIPNSKYLAVQADFITGDTRYNGVYTRTDLIIYDIDKLNKIIEFEDIVEFEVTDSGKLIVIDENNINIFDKNLKLECKGNHESSHHRPKDISQKVKLAASISIDQAKDILLVKFEGTPTLFNINKCEVMMKPSDLVSYDSTRNGYRVSGDVNIIKGTSKFIIGDNIYDYVKKEKIGAVPNYSISQKNSDFLIEGPNAYRAYYLDSFSSRLYYRKYGRTFWWDFNRDNHCKSGYFGSGLTCNTYYRVNDSEINLVEKDVVGVSDISGYFTVHNANLISTFDKNELKFYSKVNNGSVINKYPIRLQGGIAYVGRVYNGLIPLVDINGVLYLVNLDVYKTGKNVLDDDYVRFDLNYNKEMMISIKGGYFSSDNFSSTKSIGLLYDNILYDVDMLWDVFHRPDLVKAKLNGENIETLIGDFSIDKAIKNPAPKVKFSLSFLETDSRNIKIPYLIYPDKGGVAEVRVFHNGKLISSDGTYKDAHNKAFAPVGGKSAEVIQYVNAQRNFRNAASLQINNSNDSNQIGSLKNQLVVRGAPEKKCDPCKGEIEVDVIPGEENTVSIVAFNRDNTIQSIPASVTFKSSLPKEDPHLWLLSVGIDQYKGVTPLVNAKKDALDFACTYAGKSALEKVGMDCSERGRAISMFKSQNIHVIDILLDTRATKGNIQNALDRVVHEAKPSDTFIWFVASHGMMDANSLFGIVTHDTSCLNDKCTDISGHITSNEILETSKKIKAMKQLLVFDTCHSGGLDSKMSGLYDARMSLLAKNMGLHMYASAQATEQAQDGVPGANGIFTAQLLEGIKGAAPKTKEGAISIMTLGRYAKQKTIDATTSKGNGKADKGEQTPVIQHFGLDAGLVGANFP